MIRTLTTTVAALALMTSAAAAQPSATADSTSAAQAGSQAGSVAGSVLHLDQSAHGNQHGPDEYPVSSAVAPDIQPTAPCRISLSGGVQLVGFGASAGSSAEDTECTRREAFRVLVQAGLPETRGMVLQLAEAIFNDAMNTSPDEAEPARAAAAAPANDESFAAEIEPAETDVPWADASTATRAYCSQYAPAAYGGSYASAPSGWNARCL